MTNCYISYVDVLRSPTGLETDSLLGNRMRLSNAVSAGGMSLPVTPVTTEELKQFDEITIFDGSNSEIVQAASTVAVGASSIPLLQPLQFAHVQYLPLCSDGVLGSLADCIVKASDWLDNIIDQTLLSASYTGEKLSLPTMAAAIDNQGSLVLRPRNRPVTAFSSVEIEWQPGNSMSFLASQAEIDSAGRVVTISTLQQSQPAAPATWPGQPINRNRKAWVTIDYVAGYTPATIPQIIADVAILLTSIILGRRQNPTGASEIDLADKKLTQTIARDSSGDNLLMKEIKEKLSPYLRKAY